MKPKIMKHHPKTRISVRRMQNSLPNNQDDHPSPPVPSLSRRMNHPAEAEKYAYSMQAGYGKGLRVDSEPS